MIQKVDVNLHNSQQVLKVRKNTNPVYHTPTNKIEENIAFKGLRSDIQAGLLKSLEKIKSRIPHNVIVVSGPSGVGKDAIIKAFKQLDPYSKKVVAYTTRAMRTGESEGIDYHYISKNLFDEMNSKGEFFNPLVKGDCYGTTIKEVNSKRMGGTVFINMSADQAYKVKNIWKKDAVSIFIKPPSMEELKNRLINRGTETPEKIKKRFNDAKAEMTYCISFDKIIINDKLEDAVKETMKYIKKRSKFTVKLIDSLIALVKQNGKTNKINLNI